MSGERDPLLAAELARRPVFDHGPGFWDDLDRALGAAGPADGPAALPDAEGGGSAADPTVTRPGHRRPRSRAWSRLGPHRGRWLLVAAMVLVAGGLAATLVPDRGRSPSIIADDPTTTTPTPVAGGGPPTILDRDGQPLTPELAVGVALATVDDLLASDPRYLGAADADERAQLLADGGLIIRTTIDGTAQRAALDARANAGGDGTGAGATVTAIDPATGAIMVAVDDEPLADSLYRRTVEPDDAMAPLTLAAAFDRAGVLPEDTVDGTSPCEFADPSETPDPWEVRNRDGGPGAVATVRQQVVARSDCAWVRLGLAIGIDTIVDTGTALGVTSGLHDHPSIMLGAADLSVVHLTSAYATLAADGVHRQPYLIESVSQGDQVLFQHAAPASERAVSADAACHVTSVLASVRTADEPLMSAIDAVGISGGQPATGAGLYAGYTTSLAITVWIGLSGAPDAAAAAVWNQFAADYRPTPPEGDEFLVQLCSEPSREPRPVEAG